ncbi:DNA-3-methyladenine glycosylase [Rubrobacter xylanophilus]|uniref:DNA-3-methyladenine glycosylase II n=1 Tax=Rubrobacter xylanophilus TaxID=49319 RepID=A0A510HFE1_9ACTN|nr:DNA-3-methyladenine glycosylase [Rubrobacter xylanophilus]BBL78670.1 DNA-3-methyladenine glycosylase [Rubrobacter xylanophilus]
MRRVGPLGEEGRSRGRPEDPYGALVRTVVGQQLSVRAARSIYGRLCARFGGRPPLPGELEAVSDDELRACGVSGAKARCLRELARSVEEGSLPLGELGRLSDEEVVSRLTAVRGIGRWSAEMFLIFHLRRPDVLPVGDLGLRRAAALLYRLPEPPGPEAFRRLAMPWRPWRTTACLYLWRSLDALPG